MNMNTLGTDCGKSIRQNVETSVVMKFYLNAASAEPSSQKPTKTKANFGKALRSSMIPSDTLCPTPPNHDEAGEAPLSGGPN